MWGTSRHLPLCYPHPPPPSPTLNYQGNYSELMVVLSNIFSEVRGDTLAEAQGGSAQVRKKGRNKLLGRKVYTC